MRSSSASFSLSGYAGMSRCLAAKPLRQVYRKEYEALLEPYSSCMLQYVVCLLICMYNFVYIYNILYYTWKHMSAEISADGVQKRFCTPVGGLARLSVLSVFFLHFYFCRRILCFLCFQPRVHVDIHSKPAAGAGGACIGHAAMREGRSRRASIAAFLSVKDSRSRWFWKHLQKSSSHLGLIAPIAFRSRGALTN